jgi:hypothetical protein
VPGKMVHRLCPSSLGCLLPSGSNNGFIFPIPARPGRSGVRSTAGGVLACSPKDCPSVDAAPDVSLPHPDGLSVFGFAAKTGELVPRLNKPTAVNAMKMCTAFIIVCAKGSYV